ncbi:MAG TPA: hypothetical protein VFB74_21645 [Kribbellaceae bacterium]|nr:hypothetical protein [Kribbellaceae bacterium]
MPVKRRRTVAVLAGLLVTGLAAVIGVAWLMGDRDGIPLLPDPERCTARASGSTVVLDLEQAENAAIIAGVAVRRGLPARAVTIALATAYQESDIRNLDHGDRDSLGLFQQRPSMGWGTPAQVRDPHHAAGRFYDALVKIMGYERMQITVAADKVQRSAFPKAYADHEADARALASVLTGYSPAGLNCVVRHDTMAAETLGANGLTKRANAVRTELFQTFGKLPVGGFRPGGIRTGHMEGSTHYDGRAVDVFARPISAENKRRGWAYAQFLVAHADRLGIQTVIFDDRIWTAGFRSDSGWRAYTPPSRDGSSATLRHLDHVHVDVVQD